MSYGMGVKDNNKQLSITATVIELQPDGVIVSFHSGDKAIIPIEHLEQHNVAVSDFRVGETFGVFQSIIKRKGGRREVQMVNGLPVVCLSYKNNSGSVYDSSKLDRIKSGINDAFEQFSEEKKRTYLFGILEDLLWDDIDAMFQLYDYCLNRRKKIDARVERLLIAKYVLNEDGSLPDRTNEVMYEMRTGYRPFWLKEEDEKKIIDITDYLKNRRGEN